MDGRGLRVGRAGGRAGGHEQPQDYAEMLAFDFICEMGSVTCVYIYMYIYVCIVFSVQEMKDVGFSASQLKDAGFSAKDMAIVYIHIYTYTYI